MRTRAAAILLILAAGCSTAPDEPALDGRAVLPADTFAPGPAVGHALDDTINGRTPPFPSVPVQGFSSVVAGDDGTVLVLGDNGFGVRANSPAYPLRWYRLRLHLDFPPRAGGRVDVLAVTDLADPRGLAPFARRGETGHRVLTGSDFDPESFVRLADGTFWVGEEFGPALLHLDAGGALLAAPVAVPIPEPLRPLVGGQETLRSPDHPDFHSLNEDLAKSMANHPRSGGLEGLALAPDGVYMYAVVERAFLDDPRRDRRLVLEFDTAAAAFTGRWWTWRVDDPLHDIASADCTPGGALLVTERDGKAGAETRFKRVFRAPLGQQGTGEDLAKTLIVDLLAIPDPDRMTEPEDGAVGLGDPYAFPYVTPECLMALDGRTLLVGNDNNYPMSDGRRPGVPDDNEFIRIRLPADLDRVP
ncbi:MAG: esterase-like activity of phytase family protein [bacterium]|nr:esterase-like activity of phytase family protein [bacterium]